MEYIYYWYHGGLDWSTVEDIEDAINDGDFDLFIKYQKKYPRNLPNRISVFSGNDIIDHVEVTDKVNFMKITYNEHENG